MGQRFQPWHRKRNQGIAEGPEDARARQITIKEIEQEVTQPPSCTRQDNGRFSISIWRPLPENKDQCPAENDIHPKTVADEQVMVPPPGKRPVRNGGQGDKDDSPHQPAPPREVGWDDQHKYRQSGQAMAKGGHDAYPKIGYGQHGAL